MTREYQVSLITTEIGTEVIPFGGVEISDAALERLRSHVDVLTTFPSYGMVARDRQGEILNALSAAASAPTGAPDEETVKQVLAHLMKKES